MGEAVAVTRTTIAPAVGGATVIREGEVGPGSRMTIGTCHWRSRHFVCEVQCDSVVPEIDREQDRLTTVAGVELHSNREGPLEVREPITPQVTAHSNSVPRSTEAVRRLCAG